MSAKHLNYLDGWRGLAISLLLIGHFFPQRWLALGTAGVNLFFVLSGLLMAQLLFMKKVAIPAFFKRRISRVFPTLYFFIAAVLAIYAIAELPISTDETLGTLALIRNYYPAGWGSHVPFDHIWSLCVEEHSYILLGLIALVSRSKNVDLRVLIGAVTAVTVGMCLWYSYRHGGANLYSEWLIHSEVSAFGIFSSAFLAVCFAGKTGSKIPAVLYPLLAAIGIGLHYRSVPWAVSMTVGVGALALLVNILDRSPSWVTRILSIAPLRTLGAWSFSIYLWQQPFMLLKENAILPAPLALLCALAVGICSFYCLERPARAYLNNNWDKTRYPIALDPAVNAES